MERQILIKNILKIHTTSMGLDRIKKNLKIDGNIISYIK